MGRNRPTDFGDVIKSMSRESTVTKTAATSVRPASEAPTNQAAPLWAPLTQPEIEKMAEEALQELSEETSRGPVADIVRSNREKARALFSDRDFLGGGAFLGAGVSLATMRNLLTDTRRPARVALALAAAGGLGALSGAGGAAALSREFSGAIDRDARLETGVSRDEFAAGFNPGGHLSGASLGAAIGLTAGAALPIIDSAIKGDIWRLPHTLPIGASLAAIGAGIGSLRGGALARRALAEQRKMIADGRAEDAWLHARDSGQDIAYGEEYLDEFESEDGMFHNRSDLKGQELLDTLEADPESEQLGDLKDFPEFHKDLIMSLHRRNERERLGLTTRPSVEAYKSYRKKRGAF